MSECCEFDPPHKRTITVDRGSRDMTNHEKRIARKHAKRLLRDQIGLTCQTSPSRKKYKKLLNEFAVNIYKLNTKLKENKVNEPTGN